MTAQLKEALEADARWIVLADARDPIAQIISTHAAQAAPKTAASRLPARLILCRHQRDVHKVLSKAARSLAEKAKAREPEAGTRKGDAAAVHDGLKAGGPRILRVGIFGSSMVLRGALTYYVDFQAETPALPPFVFAFVPSSEAQPLVASLKQADGRYARLFGDSEWNAMVCPSTALRMELLRLVWLCFWVSRVCMHVGDVKLHPLSHANP